MKNKKFKVLIIIYSLNYGGAEVQVVQDILLLLRNNIDVYLFYKESGPLLRYLPKEVKLANFKFRSFLLSAFQLLFYLLFKRFDVVISHMFWANKISAFATFLTRHKLIIFEHGLGLWKNKPRKIASFIISLKASKVITCSYANKKIKVKHEKINENKIDVIHNSYRTLSFLSNNKTNNYIIGDKRKKICFLGRIEKVKKLDIFIEIDKILSSEITNYCYLIIGDGTYKNLFINKLVENNIIEKFIFTGFVQNPIYYLKKSDCLVLPSKSEDFSLALLEASHAGLPCVAFDVGGNSEIIIDGFSGFIIKPYDYNQFAEAILFLLKNPAVARKMGLNAKNHVMKNFSEKNREEKIMKLLYSFLR